MTIAKVVKTILLGLSLVGSDFVASTIPLKITHPMAQDVAGDGLAANHRIYKQYPGIPYETYVGVIGGKYPYNVQVSGISGMTIENRTLDNGNTIPCIVWNNPTTGTHTYTVVVTDYDGTVDSQTIEVVVSTVNHLFIDSSVTTSGDGTEGSPYKNLIDLYNNQSTAAANSICWFHQGTYTTAGIEQAAAGEPGELRIEFSDLSGDNRCVTWVAYPGEATPVIDFGYNGSNEAPRIRMTGTKQYVDGIHFTNGWVMGLQFDRRSNRGEYVANCIFDSLNVMVGSSNQAHIMHQGSVGPEHYSTMIVCNDFSLPVGKQDVANALKIYWDEEMLIEGNYFHDMDAPIELKDTATYFTIRNNVIRGNKKSIGGNVASNGNTNATKGDICYNQIQTDSIANGDGALILANNRTGLDGPGPFYIFRNTIIGRILIPGMESTHGPHRFKCNVALNDEGGQSPIPYITDSGTTFDSSRVIWEEDNLAANFDDVRVNEATGVLSGSWSEYNGRRGHRVAA